MSPSTSLTTSATACRAAEGPRLAAPPSAKVRNTPDAGDPVRLRQPPRAFAVDRGIRQHRGADTLLHHQPNGFVVVELGVDLQRDAAPGEQRFERGAQAVAEDQRGAVQLFGRNRTRRPRAGAGHQHHFLLGEPGRGDQPAARDLRHQRQIHEPGDDEFFEPHRAGMHDLELDQRIVAAHPGKQLGHHDRAQGGGDAEDDLAAGMRLVRPDLVAGALDVAQDALGAVEQLLPGLGQPHAAVGAGEQGGVELVLEPLDVPGQCRLRNLQMRRGAGDAAELGDADEIVEAAQFHGGVDSAHPRRPRSTGIVRVRQSAQGR